ncbi:MAG TPA: hypothetical protein VMW08_05725, partial [Acidimicrobiales bacterium]|nr:hypothetical protein [Acidimicrobiales bacterium]
MNGNGSLYGSGSWPDFFAGFRVCFFGAAFRDPPARPPEGAPVDLDLRRVLDEFCDPEPLFFDAEPLFFDDRPRFASLTDRRLAGPRTGE